MSLIVLSEGLGSVLRNLATGDVEDEIKELAGEAKDIKTPEQQRIVLTKIMHLMEKLVQLRHNPGWMAKRYHDSVSWFSRHLGGGAGVKELSVRTSESIGKLARIRDAALAKRWDDDEKNQQLAAMKDRLKAILDKAATKNPLDE
jgi:hypothetical protein